MRPIIKIVDALTGEVIEREMTDDEFADYETQQAQKEAEKLAKEQAETDRLEKIESAKNKLAALGLTSEEIAAITGA